MNSGHASLPQVSVVIATRNRVEWLQQCVDSVRNQQGVSHELIIVDDHSDVPAARQLIDFYRRTGGVRVRQLDQHSERSVARNHGLAMARADYVMFLDDDDLLWPRSLHKLLGALEARPGVVAAVGARWEVFCTERYERRAAHPRRLRCRSILDELQFGWSAVSGQNLYRTSAVREVGGFGAIIPCEDRLLWMQVARCGKVVLLPDIVMSYHYHSAQSRHAGIVKLRDSICLLYTSPSPRDGLLSRMPSSA